MPKYPCHKKLIGMLSLQEQQLNRMYGVYAARWSDVLKGFGYGKSSSTNLWKGNRRIEAELDKIMLDFNTEVNNYIKGNIDLGWNASDDCNDELVDKYTKGIDLNNKQVYYARNHEALAAFRTRNINGISLSDRVWAMTYQTKDQIESILGSGIMEGRSAAKMARDLKGYLVEPDRRYRRIRNDQGKLIYSSPGKDYHPGQGVYRSSYKNALRLSRDQTNTAYRSSDNERRRNLDFVMGIEVHLSDQHPKYDICDPLAGRYPKDFNFIGWHSQCICFSTSVLLSEKEFIEYVNGGKIREQRYIRTIPKSAQNYLNDHSKQIKGWKNTPYFIQDNFKSTKDGFALKKGVITRKANVPIKAPMVPVELPTARLIKSTTDFTDNNVKKVIMSYAKDRPENFIGGLRGVSIVKNLAGAMANERLYRNGKYIVEKGNKIKIRKVSWRMEDGNVFSPNQNLAGALKKISQGSDFTFQEEYALEALWHEMRHAGAKGWGNVRLRNERKVGSMEIINQFVARHTYDEFIKDLGGKSIHKASVISKGYGYSNAIDNFRNTLKRFKINEDSALRYFRDKIQTENYEDIDDILISYLRGNGVPKASDLVGDMFRTEAKTFNRLLDDL